LLFAGSHASQHGADAVLGFSKAGSDRGGAKPAFLCFIFWFLGYTSFSFNFVFEFNDPSPTPHVFLEAQY